MGGTLKPEKCWWYLINYTCEDEERTYADIVPHELYITNPNGTKSSIKQEEATVSKKTLEIHNLLAGGNTGHLDHIKIKATTWVNRMTN